MIIIHKGYANRCPQSFCNPGPPKIVCGLVSRLDDKDCFLVQHFILKAWPLDECKEKERLKYHFPHCKMQRINM